MADDWIKMRTDLYRDPKVCLIADSLMDSKSDLAMFVSQICQRDMTITRNVTRCATVGALVTVWGVMRHRGQRVGDDLFCPRVTVSVIDDIADLPGFGEAMEFVGWVKQTEKGLCFPNFFTQYNTQPDASPAAERQRRYRDKLRASRTVTRDVTRDDREEKRREEKRREKEQEVLPVRIAPISAGELPSDLSPAMLARQWCFVCTRRFNGRSKDDERDMAGEFANLEGLGVPAAAMLEEINRGPPQRDRGEHFWQFKDRLMERFNLKQQATGKPEKKSALDRLIEGAGTRKP